MKSAHMRLAAKLRVAFELLARDYPTMLLGKPSWPLLRTRMGDRWVDVQVRIARPSQRSLVDPLVYKRFRPGAIVRAIVLIGNEPSPVKWEVFFIGQDGKSCNMPAISSLTEKRNGSVGSNRSDRAASALGGGGHDLRVTGDTRCVTH